ncbi:MAG: hypothetical protein QG570_596 [Patescibacteria group bacterium]|nr:hypothetical protein [Patescibacteria group bacterium]
MVFDMQGWNQRYGFQPNKMSAQDNYPFIIKTSENKYYLDEKILKHENKWERIFLYGFLLLIIISNLIYLLFN